MLSKIIENKPNKFVSIKHYGILSEGKEITEGPDVEKWAGGLENYSFEEHNDTTTITVELYVTGEFESFFDETYPRSLAILKEIAENS